MSDVLRFQRGCRPGKTLDNNNSSGREAVRLANLQRYMLRAEAGLPIFDDVVMPQGEAVKSVQL